MELIERAAALAPLKAFPVIGRNGERAWRRLAASGAVTVSPAPHESDLQVLAGEVPEAFGEAVHQLFETLALPRLAVCIGGSEGEILPNLWNWT